METEDIQVMVTELKGVARKKDWLNKLEKKMMHVWELYSILHELSDKRRNGSSFALDEANVISRFKEILPNERIATWLSKTLTSALSSKKTVRKRWAENIKRYRDSVNTYLKNLEREKSNLKQKISLHDYPIAREIGDSIEILVREFLETEYANLVIRPKILGIVREIVRDNITVKKWLDTILFSLFNQSQAGWHIHGQQSHRLSRYLGRHRDSQRVGKG
jgi:uncharacterized protein YaaR (DUF327 family)